MTATNILLIIGIALIVIGTVYTFISGTWLKVEGSSNSTSNMTLECVRMFYSDSWDKGYVVDLAKYCNDQS